MLHICPTPIGNLRDITLRVLEVLGSADLVVCEDTRRTKKLLAAHGIRAELFSFFESREEERLPLILRRLEEGQDVALVTDAGMPGFSDPGFRLVRACIDAGLPFSVLPGPSAVDTAIVASGFPIARFVFVGFLPRGSKKVVQTIEQADRAESTVAAYESPKRLPSTLRTIAERWPARQVAVCRELTKMYEEVLRGTASELAVSLADGVKGEIVLVLAPVAELLPRGARAAEVRDSVLPTEVAVPVAKLVQDLMHIGVSATDTARLLSKLTGKDRRSTYDAVAAYRRNPDVKAVVFDMDGVLVDSQAVWMRVLREVVTERGGEWIDEWAPDEDPDTPTGDNSLEWSGYLVRRYGLKLTPEEMVSEVVRRIRGHYQRDLPVVPGAVEAVRRLAGRFRLAVASSSPRALIDHVLEGAGLLEEFDVTVSSDEVGRGKPAPDVYLQACALLGVTPAEAVAVEDTGHGLRAAKAAGMRVLLVKSGMLPISDEDLAAADHVLGDLSELTPELLTRTGGTGA